MTHQHQTSRKPERARRVARLSLLAAAAVTLAPFAPTSARADAASDAAAAVAKTRELQARVDKLSAEITELKKQRATPDASAPAASSASPASAPAASPAPAAASSASAAASSASAASFSAAASSAPASAAVPSAVHVTLDSNGLNFALPDKSAALKLGLYFQLDQRSWIDGASNDTFLLRRVRLPVSGAFAGGALKFSVIPEFQGADNASGGDSKLYDAWAEFRHSPALGLRLGKFGSPVSLDSTDPRHFIEATYTNQIVPNRDIGADLNGTLADGAFGYRLGLYNGAPNNDYASTANLDDHFSGGLRLSFAPFKNSGNAALSGLFFGAGAVYGSEKYSTANGIRSGGQQTLLPAFTARGEHLRAAAGLGYFYGPFSVLAEIAADHYAHAGPAGSDRFALRAVTNHGWYVSTGWVLTGEKSTFVGVTPAAPFNPAKGHWGAFEITARLSGLEVDKDLRGPATAGGAFAYGLGLNWWFTKNVLFRLGVERTHFSGLRKPAPPALLPAALRNDELYLFSRLQVAF